MDCTEANSFIEGLSSLLIAAESLYWIYPFTWGIVIVRKIFYA